MKTLRDTLRSVEQNFRTFRDERLIRPLARSRLFRKQLPVWGDASVFDFGDHSIAVDPDDMLAAWLRDQRGWERERTMRIFDALPRRSGVFVDVGANIGTQTVYALMFGGFERAVCFEPDPRNLRALRLNVAINGLSERVAIIAAAAGAETGEASLSLSQRSGCTNSLAERRGDKSITVAVVSVEDELNNLGIGKADLGLAWMDVEGFEGEVLKGWPCLSGTPVAIEYSPEIRQLPVDSFSGWQRWADVRDEINWRPIAELDLAGYSKQLDLLFV